MGGWLKQSTANTVKLGPAVDSTDGNTQEPGLTIAQADIRLTKNGGAYAQTNNVAGATHDEKGNYGVPLNTTDTNTLGTLRVHIHVAGALAFFADFMVVPANVYDALIAGTDVLQADVTQLGGVTQSLTDLKDFADSGYDPATNKVEGVKLVDTTTANTDMVGTDNAALASVCTEARLAELDIGNLPTDIAAIPTTAMRGTDNAALASALATHDGKLDTAQTDLDTITGADGTTLATSQGNYAPSKAGDLMNLADNAITPAKYNDAAAYIPYDGGIWIDSGAANTNTVVGVDGLPSNPVSTLVAARTLANAIGVQRYYITNSSSLALAATHQNWEFVGLGRASSILSLGGQDVDNSEFRNLSVTGLQGGANLIQMVSCLLTSLSALKIWARKCCLSGDITIAAGSMFIFDQCLSAVAGAATPVLTFSPGATTVQFRHYSGGLEVKSMTSDHTMSYETDGQLIVNANCTSGVISARGNMSITDNGTTMNITKDAVWNTSQSIQSVTDDVGITQAGADKVNGPSGAVIPDISIGAPPSTPTPQQYRSTVWAALVNQAISDTSGAGEWKIFNASGTLAAKGTITDASSIFTRSRLGAPS